MKTLQIGDFTYSEFTDVDVYERTTGLLDFRLEELQDFSLNHTQEETEITGRGGRVIGKKKKSKALTGSGTSGLISPGLLKVQTGGDVVYGDFKVKKSEAKIVAGNTIVTDAVALGAPGAEIGEVKLFGAGGFLKATFTQGAEATGDNFTYNPATKTITLPDSEDIVDGMSIVYGYERAITGTRINDPSDKFSQVRELWVHCFATDQCDNTYCADIHIFRADFKGDFDLDLGGDQTTHNFSFDAMPDFCNKGTLDNDLFEVFIYTDDTLGNGGGAGVSVHNDVFATENEVRDVFKED